MTSHNSKLINGSLKPEEQDNNDVVKSFAELYESPILVVSIFALGIVLFIFTICSGCNVIFQYCKEKVRAEREARAERRRHTAARESSPHRFYLSNPSEKYVSARALSSSPPVSPHSSVSYRRNFLKQFDQSIGSDNSLQQNESRITSFEEVRRFQRSIFQTTESDNYEQQEELCTDEQHSLQRRSRQFIELDNFLQENELSTSYTRCFLSRYGLNTESGNSHRQEKLREASLDELLSYQRRFAKTMDSEESLQQNESNRILCDELRHFQRERIESENSKKENESSAESSYELRTSQKRHGRRTHSNNHLQPN